MGKQSSKNGFNVLQVKGLDDGITQVDFTSKVDRLRITTGQHYPIEFDKIGLMDNLIRSALSSDTINELSSYWVRKISANERNYILQKSKERVPSLLSIEEDGSVCVTDANEECPYDSLAFVLAFATSKTKTEMLQIIRKKEKNTILMKAYQSITSRLIPRNFDLIYASDVNYYSWTRKRFRLDDMLAMPDPLSFNQQLTIAQTLVNTVGLYFLEYPDAAAFVAEERFVKPIFYQFYIDHARYTPKRPLYFSVQGNQEEQLVRYAQRRMSSFQNVEDAFALCHDLYRSLDDHVMVDSISSSIYERLQKKPGFTEMVGRCYKSIEKRMRTLGEYVDSLQEAYQDARDKYEDLHTETMVYKEREKHFQKRLDMAVTTATTDLQEQLANAKAVEKQAKSESERLRKQNANLQAYIKDQKADIDDLKSEVEDLASSLDDVNEKLAVMEEAAAPEETGERLETDEPTQEDMELLRNTRVVVLGGHGNFHHQLLEQVPNWRCVVPDKNVNTEKLVSYAELVVFMSNHMSHSMFEKNKMFCFNRKVPFVCMYSNNVSRCLNKIAKELREKKS